MTPQTQNNCDQESSIENSQGSKSTKARVRCKNNRLVLEPIPLQDNSAIIPNLTRINSQNEAQLANDAHNISTNLPDNTLKNVAEIINISSSTESIMSKLYYIINLLNTPSF